MNNKKIENLEKKKTHMSHLISLIKNNQGLTPFTFYSDLLRQIADVYLKSNDKLIEFKLIEGNDSDYSPKRLFIDPISLPLLLSLAQQLKKHQGNPIKLHLSNTPTTIRILEFLFHSDFFNLVGKNTQLNFPIGKNIFSFDPIYLGGFSGREVRPEHKLRCYSIYDDNLEKTLAIYDTDEPAKRDCLVEHYTYKVKDHFYELLFEKEHTQNLILEYIEILAELITNGVLHSQSDAFVLMFSDRYKTKFSISDNGIGLYESLKNKEEQNGPYKKFELLYLLSKHFPLDVHEKIKTSILSLFETLYFSMLKDRQGLFDLMCNVVINCSGYFRLHTDNAQIIVSARMLNELEALNETRNQIIDLNNSKLFDLVDAETLALTMNKLAGDAKNQISHLADSIFRKYSDDIRFSAIRIYEVKFRGVHIEVEIPNTK